MTDALDLAYELERYDESLAAAARKLEALDREVGAIRSTAVSIGEFLQRLPHERERLAAAAAAVADDAAAKDAAARAAAERLAEAERGRDSDTIAAARRALVAATDAAATARRRSEELGAEQARLEAAARESKEELRHLEERAETAARGLSASGLAAAEPGFGPEALDAWAAQAHSTLFVARAASQRQREAVVREANELAAITLGEPSFAASTALARRQLERALKG